ncbi:MAG TPA: SDR family oxidoreductase [Xanthomonadales bacterium]|nr:SDR family oxidoreductase [Xanthomonadales bacterium]
MKVQGSTAIVTGGNRGIGEAFVHCLIEAGARRVYVGSRQAKAAAHLVDTYPGRVVAVELDVTDEAGVAAAAINFADTQIVINNAGAYHHLTLLGAPDLRAAREEMEVNYFGVLSMCRQFTPVLARNGGGAIVNVLSVGAILAVPNMGGYCPSKFAARALTTSLRAELAEQNIQVSCLIVGSIDTRMAAHVEGRKEPPETVARAGIRAIEKNIPEMDTDAFAINIRAAMARDPAHLEKQMAKLLKAKTLATGR